MCKKDIYSYNKNFTTYSTSQMTNNPNSINSIESNIDSKKSNNFVESTKRVIRKVLTTTWIAAGSMAPVGTPSVVPASVNTITRIAPIASTTIKTISLWTAAILFSSFDEKGKYIEINNIRPVDILPIIWQVEAWDKNVYEHIEHLRVAEATRIRDMMWKYWAGNHSAEEYQQLMNRLNTGMTLESPLWYNNYEVIWWSIDNPSDHAHCERSILDALIDHANFKIVSDRGDDRNIILSKYVKDNPNSINIFWNSVYRVANNKEEYNILLNDNNIRDLCKSENILIFAAWTNVETTKNKIYNWEYEADEKWMYSLASLSNSDKNDQPNTHLLVTIATNKNWDIDQTGVDRESSKYPVWFSNNVLFSWRWFPQHREWTIYWPSWRYTTSDTNYFNVAMADLCFQMFAEVKDVDELLEMIRATCLTDYIRLDGQTQELQLMNPAWFFQKYLMPTAIPTNLDINETIALEKGYYHGVIYQIPGAEVNINGEWLPFSDDNKDLILTQNPMSLNWRLNGKLLNEYSYKSGDTINGKIIVVDDKWNGLNISKDFSVNLEGEIPNDINTTKTSTPSNSNTRYTIDGHHLKTKPTKPGIYITNGQKIIVK